MKELALHILDLVQNSIKAEASLVEITVCEDIIEDLMTIKIIDNGVGMDEDTLKKVEDPFFTTRTTRKVGLGISLFKAAAVQCNGSFKIDSEKGKGTRLEATFQYSHIDRAPLGSIEDTIATLLMTENDMDYIYTHYYNNNSFCLNTREVKKILKGLPISDIRVIEWMREYIKKELLNIVKT
ncbi:ATP-binding protein [Natronincola ferrireducens]|uniref:histidine kinase n=1 Tax=Natronincola ferrireducens TaxID=393762 RepID=A0A1G9D4D8_9FIRM|nr:ATP-binding protein [Natronincola ferrireducens]SDK58792.1 Histidine kinase-, DNA gyrase B-, and HSP90-like ATPase [Natronincola ferrireducens]